MFWGLKSRSVVMSWNAFLVSLGAGRSSSIRHIPKELARMTAAALRDPVTPTAAVGFIADFQIDVPASEMAANARVLNLSQGFAANHDLATNIRRPKTVSHPDLVNHDYVFTDGAWHGIGTPTASSGDNAEVEASGSDAVAT
jgi:hypothetical protein